ncbi:MAG: hypothetical protein JNN08_07315 [Bryobacterales bacterium]|nr:hypothetical protein [Bryobacterales bacterium]
MPITLHPELEARIRARADAAGLTVETYIERMVRDDEFAEEDLEGLAIEGLESGKSVEADAGYWAERRRRLIERHRQTVTP